MGFSNEAGWDRILRILVGVAMIYLGWSGAAAGLLGATLRVFGFLPILTGFVGWDPIYAILRLSTKRGWPPT